ncbi:hypothetical protein SARC_04576 [Sphaeroforma arctica JP610]|uniref:Apple domain-containing protein n=1 Tax=Sphaeroforma arctica JP610 TaxID=667725 RepID=A0A0L0G274_9EUKA|nr:hypothetical protein SARC_04576 [Sphaeroforma arctica JP610]KNC83170.1 hypothetical protein SARC_04576 [Sphaeroforma arctica JP610]|eukprot:XP_014157072.1 hypothetical protein SARC_04576 [Sphaeroforma arctica JP610]
MNILTTVTLAMGLVGAKSASMDIYPAPYDGSIDVTGMGQTFYKVSKGQVLNEHKDIKVDLKKYEYETTLDRFDRGLEACANHKGCMSFDLIEENLKCYLTYKIFTGWDDGQLKTDKNAVLGFLVQSGRFWG